MDEKSKFDRGMYKGAKISVKILDRIIISGILLLAGIIIFSVNI